MIKKLIKKILHKQTQDTPIVERRKGERRKSDRRWMSKLLGEPEVQPDRRSGGDRRMGDRRKN